VSLLRSPSWLILVPIRACNGCGLPLPLPGGWRQGGGAGRGGAFREPLSGCGQAPREWRAGPAGVAAILDLGSRALAAGGPAPDPEQGVFAKLNSPEPLPCRQTLAASREVGS